MGSHSLLGPGLDWTWTRIGIGGIREMEMEMDIHGNVIYHGDFRR